MSTILPHRLPKYGVLANSVLAPWYKDVSVASVFTYRALPNPNWQSIASVLVVQINFTLYVDTPDLLFTYDASPDSIPYYRVFAVVGVTVRVTPPFLFSCPYKASLMNPLRILSVDDFLTIVRALSERTPRLRTGERSWNFRHLVCLAPTLRATSMPISNDGEWVWVQSDTVKLQSTDTQSCTVFTWVRAWNNTVKLPPADGQ